MNKQSNEDLFHYFSLLFADDTKMDTSGDSKEIHQNGDINGDLNGHDKTEKQKAPLMFKFTLVNSYGSTEISNKLSQDGQALRLSNRTYVAVDWNPLAQEKFYDDKAAEVRVVIMIE